MFMIKTLVNKIRFEGPKTHNEILAKVRTDIYETGTGIAVETLSFIVSSFFSKEGLFRDIEKRKIIYYWYIGKLLPATKANLAYERNNIQRVKRKAAVKYLKKRHKDACFSKTQRILRWYSNWSKYRESKNYSCIDLETFVRMHKIKFPIALPVSEAAIQGVLYKFNDKGRIIFRRGTKKDISYIISRKEKEKAEKALLNQH